LSHKGFEHFFPTYSARRRWSDRMKTVEAALFPGYVFCRIDIQKRLPVLTAPGVVNIVGIGKTPAIIPEHEIERIKLILRSGLLAEPWPYLTAGTQIRIEQGPLAGCEGILVRTKGQTRLVATVDLLQRAVAVEIERDWARPARPQSRVEII